MCTTAITAGAEDGTIGDLSADEPISAHNEIVEELTGRRDGNTKHYRLKDGSVMAVMYSEPVHKEENGRFVDIDNTLVEGQSDYANLNGVYDVRFAKKAKNNKMVTLNIDGYEISFGFDRAKSNSAKAFNKQSGKKGTLEKIASRVEYKNVLSDTDLRYDLDGGKLKESIILNKYNGQSEFVFNYKFGSLLPEKDAAGTVLLKNREGEPVAVIDAPYMFDASGAQSTDIDVTLVKHGSGYRYILTASENWLNSPDRVYPVTIDPTTSTYGTSTTIYDTYINYQKPTVSSFREGRDRLLVGTSNGGGEYSSTFEGYRTYIWFDMPEIPIASRVSNALLTLYCHPAEWKNYQDIEEDIRIDLYELLPGAQSANTVCWNNRDSVAPAKDMPADYQCLKTGALNTSNYYYRWNVTSLIDDYYEIKNSGNAPAGYAPGMMLRYADESAETNDFYAGFYSGNANTELKPSITLYYTDAKGIEDYYDSFASSPDNGGTGYVNSFNGNVTYINTLISETGARMPITVSAVFNNADRSKNTFGLGNGWKFSFNQFIEHITGTYEYYAYFDADGTVHYFSMYDGRFTDESGSGLELTDDGSKITLTAEGNKGKVEFLYKSDGKAYISRAEDSAGNAQTYSYDGTNVIKATDGAGREITVAYSSGKVTKITDPAGRATQFSYSGKTLSKITYPDGKCVNFTYSNGLLTCFKASTGAKTEYAYDGFNRVSGITEYDRLNRISGEYKITLEHKNTTRISDKYGNELLYQFDFYGKTVSVKDENGSAVYSAYSNMMPGRNGAAEENYYLRNKLLTQSGLQNTVTNYVYDNSAEQGMANWTVESGTAGVSEDYALLGYNSFALQSAEISLGFNTLKKNHSYTLSAYVLGQSGAKARLQLRENGVISARGEEFAVSDSWERISLPFVFSGQNMLKICLVSQGKVYFDCIQLEDGTSANRFNLVEDSGNESSFSWTRSSGVSRVTEYADITERFPQSGVLYSESFDSFPAHWSGFANSVTVENGTMVMKNRANSWSSPAYEMFDLIKANGAGTYAVMLKVRASAVPENAQCRMILRSDKNYSFISNTGNFCSLSDAGSITAGEWKELIGTLTVTEDDISADSGSFKVMIDTLGAVDGQSIAFDDVKIIHAESNALFNGDFAYKASLWEKNNCDITSETGKMYVHTRGGSNTFAKYDISSILHRFGEHKYYFEVKATADAKVDVFLINEKNQRLELGSISAGSALCGAQVYINESTFDISKKVWLCIGSTATADITVTNVKFYPVSEGNKVIKISGDYMNSVTAYKTIHLNVPDSGSLVVGGWAKADAVPDNESHGSGRWFGMYAKIRYADTNGATKIVPIEFNTAVRIDGSTDDTPWQYVCAAVPLDSDYKTPINVLDVQIYLCYNRNLNTAYFDNIQVFYESFGTSYSYDEKGNVISGIDKANQRTNFDSKDNKTSSLHTPSGSDYEYVYNDKDLLTMYRSSTGVGATYSYDSYGNPTSVKVSSNAESCAIEDGGEYYIVTDRDIDGLPCILQRENGNVTGQMFGTFRNTTKMKFHLTEDGYFKIENDGKYLERSETSDNFYFNAHNYGKGQDWIVEPFEDGYKIKSRVESAKRYIGIGLESAYLTGGTGVKLHLFKSNSINRITSTDQIVSENRYTIVSRESGKYLSYPTYEIPQVSVGGELNAYTLIPADDGYYYILYGYDLATKFGDYLYEHDGNIKGSQGYWEYSDDFKFVPAYDGFAIQTKSGKYLCVDGFMGGTQDIILTDTINQAYGVWYLYEYSKEIVTSAEYTPSKNYMSSQTDALGNTVSYSYDESKGILLSSTDAKGNQTSYSYDINDRVTNVSQGGISVNYTYDSNNQLSTVTHNGTSYSLIYDALGRSKQTKIGTRLLVDNMYFAESGLLRKAAYGNGSTREYEYDRQGRVKKMIIDGVERFSYTYDSQGNLLSYTDLVANEKFTYVYDFLGRPVQVRTSSGFKIKLTYDEFNRASDVEFVNGSESNKTSWVFGNDSIVTGVKYNGVEKISYTYDLLKRQTKKTVNTTAPFTTSYEYKNIDNYRTSTLIDKISYSDGTALSYTYDANGNILTIKDQSNNILASYTYDSLNQLTGATVGSDVYVYTYDNGGNIVSKTKNGVEVAYTYGNTEWKDLLTAYNGTSISYDTIGNPLNWINGETFTWSGGRQLTGIVKGDNTISYTYNDSGIRTSKTVNGVRTDYYLNGTAIIMQKTGDNVIWYTYDENGNVAGMNYNGSDYWFYRNAQNDVIGIVDSSGAVIAKYTYDDWGKITAVTDGQGNDISSNATHIANINPIRYRGYYYDTETGLYYLQSRYYDAEVGRFINADGYISTGQGTVGSNMFAYCLNNPVNFQDVDGEIAITTIILIGSIVAGVLVAGHTAATSYKYTGEVDIDNSIINGLCAFATVYTFGMTAYGVYLNYCDYKGKVPVTSIGGGSTTVNPAPAQQPVHGNSKNSIKAQHGYEIYNKESGDVAKTGISGRPLNNNGTSPRANTQVNALNRRAGGDIYAARVVKTNIPGRAAALEWEKMNTHLLKEQGHILWNQRRPQ